MHHLSNICPAPILPIGCLRRRACPARANHVRSHGFALNRRAYFYRCGYEVVKVHAYRILNLTKKNAVPRIAERSEKQRTSLSARHFGQHKKTGYNQHQMAEAIGLPDSTYGDYELNGYLIPHTAVMQIAEYFEVSADYLLGMTDTRKNREKSLQSLHLSDDAIDTIINDEINQRLLLEIISRPAFKHFQGTASKVPLTLSICIRMIIFHRYLPKTCYLYWKISRTHKEMIMKHPMGDTRWMNLSR